MILDNLTFLAGAMSAAGVLSGQAANGAGSILSTNTLDLASLPMGGNQIVGGGEQLQFSITVTSAPTVGASVRFELIQADDAALTTNVQVVNATSDLPIASLPLGTSFSINFGRAVTPKRYLGFRFVNTGAIATAAYIVCMGESIATLKTMIFKSGIAIA